MKRNLKIEKKKETRMGIMTEVRNEGINTLNAELNPICHLLAFFESHHIYHVSRIGVKETKEEGRKQRRKRKMKEERKSARRKE